MAASGKGGDINLNPVQTTVAGTIVVLWNIVKITMECYPPHKYLVYWFQKNGYFTKGINKRDSFIFV